MRNVRAESRARDLSLHPDALSTHCTQRLREIVRQYAEPDTSRAIVQVLNTGLPFLLLMGAMFYALNRDFWPAMLLALPAGGLLVRLFAIQHDCGHGSFFRSRWANDLLGWFLGVVTLTPYGAWRRNHAIHHATSGNLDRRGIGDVDTLTVSEYRARSFWRRAAYRLYRHPFVLFGIGPAYLFLLRHRVPVGTFRDRRIWLSALSTNLAIAAVITTLILAVGLGPFLAGYLPVMLLGASVGVWLFYVQHQFEDTYWETGKRWNFQAAALEGCSYYDLPALLHWLTGHLGLHHIHHLSSKIPNYRLRDCFRHSPELWSAKRLTLSDSLRCARLALWDEKGRRLVPFRAARRRE
ncbi:MAG TPA: fatty acid desaturase [Alphaproteobacteria bacterium]|nr:fatty acid desaturase [Alphaproteobacteria bacterium]